MTGRKTKFDHVAQLMRDCSDEQKCGAILDFFLLLPGGGGGGVCLE